MPLGWGQRILAALLDCFFAFLVALGLLSEAERVVLALKFKNSLRARPVTEVVRIFIPEKSIPTPSSVPQKEESAPVIVKRVRTFHHGRYGLIDSDDEDAAEKSTHDIPHSQNSQSSYPVEMEMPLDTSLESFEEMSFEHHNMHHLEEIDALGDDLLNISSPAELEDDFRNSCPWSSQKLTPNSTKLTSLRTPPYRANMNSFVDTLSLLKEKVTL